MKKIILTISIALLSSFSVPQKAEAAVFLGAVANPFVFCSLPKPCKRWCQPWRSYWEKICPAGQMSATDKAAVEQAKKDAQTNGLENSNQDLKTQAMTAESFRRELGAASLSAFSEDDQYIKEVSDWIKYQGNQVSSGKKVVDVWCEQGIYSPLSNQQLRQMAYNDIVKKNQKIVETISNGHFPPKDTKPWYDYKGQLQVSTCQPNVN